MSEGLPDAGWYEVEGNQVRYWNGQSWTEHVRDIPSAPAGARRAGSASRLRNVAVAAASNLTSDEQHLPDGTLWSAIGKSVGKVTTGRYRLDAQYIYYSKGALRTQWQQELVANVVDVDVRQSITQKTRGVFTVAVVMHNRAAFTMDDIPDGPTAQHVITRAAVDARLALEQRAIRIDGQRHEATNTVRQEIRIDTDSRHVVHPQTIAGTVVPGPERPQPLEPPSESPMALPTATGDPSRADGSDLIARLKELGELRDAGILTEEEFASKKAEILSRL